MTTETENTFPRILIGNAQRFGDKRIAFREKEFGIWQSYTWAEVARRVQAIALGLASRGFKRGDKAVVVGDNRPELYWSMVAVECLGGVPVPLYQDSIEREMEFVVAHSEARFALVEDQEQADKLLNIKGTCKKLEYIFYKDPRGMRNYGKDYLIGMADLEAEGKTFGEENPGYFEAEVEKGSPDDVAIICYTSGTTGKPKGVMLQHGALVVSCRELGAFEGLGPKDSWMAYLPMAWVGDFFGSVGLAMVQGMSVNCPESGATVAQDIREIGPTFFFGPPRIWENLLTSLMIRMDDAAWFKRKLFTYFIAIGRAAQKKKLAGGRLGFKERLLLGLGRVLVYGPLKDNLGLGRVRRAWTGGEPMGPDTLLFFSTLGIELKQIYALTEAGIFISVPKSGDIKPDTCGPPLPWVEVKISDGGEVLFKSPGTFAGYYKNEAATKETMQGGWVHTGDAGFIDHDGHLKIVDRAKDVATMDGGTIYSPKYLENKLKFSPYIREAVTVGMSRPYVTAMINIDLEAVGNWAERRNLSYTGYTDIAQKPEVYNLIRDEVRRVNDSLAEEDALRGAQIRRFLILHKELDPDDEEITRTRKVRRSFIGEKYGPLIEAMYSDEKHVKVRAEMTFEDGRKGTVDADLRIADVEAVDAVA